MFPGAIIVHESELSGKQLVMYRVDPIDKHRGYMALDGREQLPHDESQRVTALKCLGMGPPETKWCTREDFPECRAINYLINAPVFVIYYDGAPYAQIGRLARSPIECRNAHGHDNSSDVPDQLYNAAVETIEKYMSQAEIRDEQRRRQIEAEQRAAQREVAVATIARKMQEERSGNIVVTLVNGDKIRCSRVVGAEDFVYILVGPGYSTPHKCRKGYGQTMADLGIVEKKSVAPEYDPETGVKIAGPKHYLIRHYDKLMTVKRINIAGVTKFREGRTRIGANFGSGRTQMTPRTMPRFSQGQTNASFAAG